MRYRTRKGRIERCATNPLEAGALWKRLKATSLARARRERIMRSIGECTRSRLEDGERFLCLVRRLIPRHFEIPGTRLKFAEQDLLAYKSHRNEVHNRRLVSPTPRTSDFRAPGEGLSHAVCEDACPAPLGADLTKGFALVKKAPWDQHYGWQVQSRIVDELNPIPHHVLQAMAQAALVRREGKPGSCSFLPQLNATSGFSPNLYRELEPEMTEVTSMFVLSTETMEAAANSITRWPATCNSSIQSDR